MNKKYLSIRMDEKTLNKLHVVANHEKRSASNQIVMLVRECIKGYEKTHGPIGKQE